MSGAEYLSFLTNSKITQLCNHTIVTLPKSWEVGNICLTHVPVGEYPSLLSKQDQGQCHSCIFPRIPSRMQNFPEMYSFTMWKISNLPCSASDVLVVRFSMYPDTDSGDINDALYSPDHTQRQRQRLELCTVTTELHQQVKLTKVTSCCDHLVHTGQGGGHT